MKTHLKSMVICAFQIVELLVNHSDLANQMKGVGEMSQEISNLLADILEDSEAS